MATAKTTPQTAQFGDRLAAARKQRGLSQRQLAQKSGVSNRMIAYYEAQGGEPPAHVVVQLAKALQVSADELLGLQTWHKPSPKNVRLWRQLLRVQELDEQDRKVVTEMIDALVARRRTAAG